MSTTKILELLFAERERVDHAIRILRGAGAGGDLAST
jgi:hypothetical protein